MKLFWKIFFATMFVSISCLSLGGYILIHSNFQALLENEVRTAYDYGDIVTYSLANELKSTMTDYITYGLVESDGDSVAEKIRLVAPSININNMNQKISFAVMDKFATTDEGNGIVYSSLVEDLDKAMLSAMESDQKGWALQEKNGRFYVQAMRPALLENNPFYIETMRDVSYIFEARNSQYEVLLKLMAGTILLAGILTSLISKLLLRRVVFLSRLTKEFAMGNLEKRALLKGNDEITELSENFNRMADDLEEKIRTLEEESARKERFVGAFSHELKTPLTSIIGYADMLRRRKMEEEEKHICAEYIFAEGKRLEALSLRLLELIVLKNKELSRVSTDMELFLKEICDVLAPQLRQKNICLIYHGEPAMIFLEPDLMKTVFFNLIDNGKKAIGTGGEIVVKGRWKRRAYVVTVTDTGKGMEQEELSKIKEAFYMVDKSRSRKEGGAGLGLAISDEILRLHGFAVAFRSEIGTGTEVRITMGRDGYEES